MNKSEKRRELIKLIMLFVLELIVLVGVSFAVPLIGDALGVGYSSFAVVLVLDICLVIVTILYTLKKGDRILEAYELKKIKVGTIFLAILLAIVSSPMYMFANVLSQLFVPNIIMQSMDTIFGNSTVLGVIALAVIAPIGEELVMRGFFQNRFKQLMPFSASAVLSGFLFGVLHMNFNQFCYAWVLGIIFAYANRASGSTFTSIILHMCVNGGNVALLLVMNAAYEALGMDMAELAEQGRNNITSVKSTVVVVGILAIVSFFLTRLVIRAIAKHEGTEVEVAEVEVTGVEAAE